MGKKQRQSGAVSLFSVVFATLLLTVLVTGFIGLMVRDQRQALNNELSQSAYDAALAGVEDAKRVIRVSQGADSKATVAKSALDVPRDCKVIQRAGVAGSTSDNEVKIQTTSSAEGAVFDQAYTCVDIVMDTVDYLYKAQEGSTWMIPLKASDTFDKVTLEWYSREDAEGSPVAGSPNESDATKLPPFLEWNSSTPGAAKAPPMMRAQIIAPSSGSGSFTLNDLDNTGQTLFLRPTHSSTASSTGSSADITTHPRATADAGEIDNVPQGIICSSSFVYSSEYSCKVTIQLPTVSSEASGNAFLRLTPIYGDAHVRVTLGGPTTSPKFHGIQPAVDSTGRANNLFRRVEARLDIGVDFPYPEGVVDIAGSLCKDFSVTGVDIIPGTCS